MNKLNLTTTTQRILRHRIPNATAPSYSQKMDAAIKQLKDAFAQVVEIGKFKPIKADITEPLKDSTIKKASIIIEPLANKNDFRTRTISFVAYSPTEAGKIHDVTIANGNKFAIESALKNPQLKTAFKDFIKNAEIALT